MLADGGSSSGLTHKALGPRAPLTKQRHTRGWCVPPRAGRRADTCTLILARYDSEDGRHPPGHLLFWCLTAARGRGGGRKGACVPLGLGRLSFHVSTTFFFLFHARINDSQLRINTATFAKNSRKSPTAQHTNTLHHMQPLRRPHLHRVTHKIISDLVPLSSRSAQSRSCGRCSATCSANMSATIVVRITVQ